MLLRPTVIVNKDRKLAIWAGTNNIPKLAPEACNLEESTITIGVALGSRSRVEKS
jgi:hypothetical protein